MKKSIQRFFSAQEAGIIGSYSSFLGLMLIATVFAFREIFFIVYELTQDKMSSALVILVYIILMLVFALILALLGSPPSMTPLKAAEDLSVIAYSGEDRINPTTLAEWMISGMNDYYLVDIRNPAGFADYNIPGSVNIPFTSLMSSQGLGQLPKYKKNILVYEDGSRAGQAWTVLRSRGYEVYILEGGIKGWWSAVMTPASLQESNPQPVDTPDQAAKIKAMRDHFSGKGTEIGESSSETSTPAPPPPPPVKTAGKKKKSGGC